MESLSNDTQNEIKGRVGRCIDIVCPEGANLCRISTKSFPPDFKQMLRTTECLSKSQKVLKMTESLLENPVPGQFFKKIETSPVDYSQIFPKYVKLGDLFAF
jgi:hypothetical protein